LKYKAIDDSVIPYTQEVTGSNPVSPTIRICIHRHSIWENDYNGIRCPVRCILV